MLLQFFYRSPIACPKTCQVSGSQCCCLRDGRTDHGYLQDIGLELHQQIVGRSAAIHPQLFENDATIRLHRFQHIIGLIGDAVQSRPGDMRLVGAACHAEQAAPRILIPVRCPQPGKSRHHVDAFGVGYFGGQPLHLLR